MSLDLTAAKALMVSPDLAPAPPMSRRTLGVMAAAGGCTVASVYYNQPLLGDFAKTFHSSQPAAALVSTASQVGYGTGLLLLVPLGDVVERRRLVLILTTVCVALLTVAAAATSLPMLIATQLLLGIAAVSSQILIPLGIDLSPPDRRGKTVGTLMAGLLAGILLARTVGGWIGGHYNWRTGFVVAALVMVANAIVLACTLPHHPPSSRSPYLKLMRSLVELTKNHPPLWTASVVSALSFAGFTAFWATLSFLMQDHFGRGATEAGLFGVVGLVGASAAPMAGKLSDRKGPGFTVVLSLILSAVAFVAMGVRVTIPVLVVGVLLMDLGVQSIQVAEQSLVMALVTAARSRVNTIYMVARFLGGAGGSAVGAVAYGRYGWAGVCAVSTAMVALATAVHFGGPSTKSRPLGMDI